MGLGCEDRGVQAGERSCDDCSYGLAELCGAEGRRRDIESGAVRVGPRGYSRISGGRMAIGGGVQIPMLR